MDVCLVIKQRLEELGPRAERVGSGGGSHGLIRFPAPGLNSYIESGARLLQVGSLDWRGFGARTNSIEGIGELTEAMVGLTLRRAWAFASELLRRLQKKVRASRRLVHDSVGADSPWTIQQRGGF